MSDDRRRIDRSGPPRLSPRRSGLALAPRQDNRREPARDKRAAGPRSGRERPRASASASVGRDVEHDRQIGKQPGGRDHPDHGDLFFEQAPRGSLIDDVREQVAVGDHDPPGGERRRDHLFDELGPARHVEQHLGPHRDRDRLAVSKMLRSRSPRAVPPGSRQVTTSNRAPRASPPAGAAWVRLAAAVGTVENQEQPRVRMRAIGAPSQPFNQASASAKT